MTLNFECIFYNKKHTWVLLNLFPNSPLTLTKLLQLLFPLFSSFSSSPAKHPLDLSSVSCSNSSISQQLTAWGSAKRLLHCKQITLHVFTLCQFLFYLISFCFVFNLLCWSCTSIYTHLSCMQFVLWRWCRVELGLNLKIGSGITSKSLKCICKSGVGFRLQGNKRFQKCVWVTFGYMWEFAKKISIC